MDKNNLKTIVALYSKGLLPERFDDYVQRLLISDGQEALKDDALLREWNELEVVDNKSARAALKKVKPGRVRVMVPAIWKYVAIAIITVLVGSTLYQKSSNSIEGEQILLTYQATNDEKKEIALPDGTLAILHYGSNLTYKEDTKDKKRNVYLRGEAMFTVKHDVTRQFIVHVGNQEFVDFGTTFDINASEKGKIIATLMEGSLAMRESSADSTSPLVMMKPGQQFVYDESNHTLSINTVEPGVVMSWANGGLDFQDKPLKDIIEAVELYYNVKIDVMDQQHMNDKYTIQFNANESLQTVLNIITELTDAHFIRK